MTDVELLAKCGWAEDRKGIGFAYGIMHVVMNRVKAPGFPKTIQGVILQPNAFSWTRPTDPQFGMKPSGPIYQACLLAAPWVISGDGDPTDGSLYYANLKVITPGGWFQKNIVEQPSKHPFKLKIGQHSFYA